MLFSFSQKVFGSPCLGLFVRLSNVLALRQLALLVSLLLRLRLPLGVVVGLVASYLVSRGQGWSIGLCGT